MDKPAPFSQSRKSLVRQTDSRMVQLVVRGMGSNHCAGLITAAVERLPGIININTNNANHRVTVGFDPGQLSDGDICKVIEKAYVTLVKGELSKVVAATRLSRATFRKIVENLFWVWLYNLAAIPIAAAGLLHPMIGVIAMTTSSLSLTGNSLRLKRVKLNVDK